jgi:hypothetical protein
MRGSTLIAQTFVTVLLGGWIAVSAPPQAPTVTAVDEKLLREYTGVYRWQPNAIVYLQMWDEFSGFGKPAQLVAFDETGEVRTLYPTDRDRFFAGPGAAVPTSIESRVEFQRAKGQAEIRRRFFYANWGYCANRRLDGAVLLRRQGIPEVKMNVKPVLDRNTYGRDGNGGPLQ